MRRLAVIALALAAAAAGLAGGAHAQARHPRHPVPPRACSFALDRQGFLPQRAFDAVARGDACAVDWALRVLPQMDAGNSEGLEDSLARSIRTDPERILRAIGTRPGLTAERLCTPFFSAEESARSQRPVQRAILAALARVRAPGLQRRRHACEREVRAALP